MELRTQATISGLISTTLIIVTMYYLINPIWMLFGESIPLWAYMIAGVIGFGIGVNATHQSVGMQYLAEQKRK